MKKSVKSLFQTWSDTVGNLKPGEVVEITSHGKPVALLTRPARSRRKMPDFRKLVRQDKATVSDGENLYRRMMADEGIS
jgi:antitoxin (DNA-binding transcriptional repressor) of toxin-antitoxin stability system